MITDILLMILLLTTMFFIWRLNKRISKMQKTRDDLSVLMQGFDEAIIRAELSIRDLREHSNDTSINFQKKIDKALNLSTDLAFMTDRALVLSEKLEKMISNAKLAIKTNKEFLSAGTQALTKKTEPKPKLDSTLAEKLQKTKDNADVDMLINRIEAVKDKRAINDNATNEQPYKPTVRKMDEYFQSLRKI